MVSYKRFDFSISAEDKVYAWSLVPEKPLLVLQVVHGMMEHSGRYEAFARFLAGKGIAVYMNDLRGHGKNLKYEPGNEVAGSEIHGHFADKDGWNRSIETIHELTGIIRKIHPGLPVVIMGHSMGSVLVRCYIKRFSHELDGAILSGSMLQPLLLLKAGIMLVDILKLIYGPRHRSKLIIRLGYGSYSKYFKPKRTDFDWLTCDTAIVDAYVADPFCGFPLTTGFYSDFFRGIRDSNDPISQDAKKMPILIFSGKLDPSGHFGKDPENIAGFYRKQGFNKVELKIWPEGRHEMLNELNRNDVWEHIARWILKL